MLRRTVTALVASGALAAGGIALLAPSSAEASPDQSVTALSAATGADGNGGSAVRARRLLTPERRRELRTTGHLSLTVRTRKHGTLTVLIQRGAITAMSPSSVSLRSVDGFVHTYTVTAKTKVREKRQPYSDLTVGERVMVVAVHTDKGDVARRIGCLRAAPTTTS